MNSTYARRGLAPALSLILIARAFGQTAVPPPKADDLVQLSALEVTATQNHGYISTESVTGTRVATKIAKFTSYQDFTYWHGSLGYDKVNLNLNYALGSWGGVSVANLLSVNWQNNDSASTFGFNRNRLVDDNLLLKFSDGSTLDLEV